MVLDDFAVGLLRESMVLDDFAVGLLRESMVLDDFVVGLLPESMVLDDFAVGLLRESVVMDDFAVGLHGILCGSFTVSIREVHMIQSKLFLVSGRPFKVIHQRPSKISPNITAIQPYS